MQLRRLPILLLLLSAGIAGAARDPFWPIDYSPAPPPEPAKPPEPAPAPQPRPKPPEPPKPVVQPVTEADWSQARKALAVNGFTKSVRPDTGEARCVVLIDRQTYTSGDTVRRLHNGIRFQWRVDNVTERDMRLVPLTAERLGAPAAPAPAAQPLQPAAPAAGAPL